MSGSVMEVFVEGVKQALELFGKGSARPGDLADGAKKVMEVATEVAKQTAKIAGKGK